MEENEYQPDKSGLVSLGGFSYQIKVFAMLAAELKEGETIEFETFDDVAKEKISPNTFDDVVEANIRTSITAVQVKKTKVSDKVAKGILLNWIQLENSNLNIEKFILYTESSYENKENSLINVDADALIKEVKESEEKANSNKTKVKKILEKIGEDNLKEIIARIKSKYSFDDRSIDNALVQSLKRDFAYSVNQVIFKDRLEEYLQRLTYSIIINAEKKLPYELTYEKYCRIIEEIRNDISEKQYSISYSQFQKLHPIEKIDAKILEQREYKQLVECSLAESRIKRMLVQELYYKHNRAKLLESLYAKKVSDIEITSYENFEEAKEELAMKGEDTPYNRMSSTLNRGNSYAKDDQIRKGSCIYLTGDDIEENQISWSDDENRTRNGN